MYKDQKFEMEKYIIDLSIQSLIHLLSNFIQNTQKSPCKQFFHSLTLNDKKIMKILYNPDKQKLFNRNWVIS